MKRFYKENKQFIQINQSEFFFCSSNIWKKRICVFLLLFEKLINTDKQENHCFFYCNENCNSIRYVGVMRVRMDLMIRNNVEFLGSFQEREKISQYSSVVHQIIKLHRLKLNHSIQMLFFQQNLYEI